MNSGLILQREGDQRRLLKNVMDIFVAKGDGLGADLDDVHKARSCQYTGEVVSSLGARVSGLLGALVGRADPNIAVCRCR